VVLSLPIGRVQSSVKPFWYRLFGIAGLLWSDSQLTGAGFRSPLMMVHLSMFPSLVDSQGIKFLAITLPADGADEFGSWNPKSQSRLWTLEKQVEKGAGFCAKSFEAKIH
jgi:hypothetical protein